MKFYHHPMSQNSRKLPVILIYLASEHPEAGLLPDDNVRRAQMESWLLSLESLDHVGSWIARLQDVRGWNELASGAMRRAS